MIELFTRISERGNPIKMQADGPSRICSLQVDETKDRKQVSIGSGALIGIAERLSNCKWRTSIRYKQVVSR